MAKDTTSRAQGSARGGKSGRGGRPAQASKAQGGAATIAAPERETRPRTNPFAAIANFPRFTQEVRAEARKITWPSRKETWITSVMVFIMLGITTLFFFVVDVIVGWGVGQVIKIGG